MFGGSWWTPQVEEEEEESGWEHEEEEEDSEDEQLEDSDFDQTVAWSPTPELSPTLTLTGSSHDRLDEME